MYIFLQDFTINYAHFKCKVVKRNCCSCNRKTLQKIIYSAALQFFRQSYQAYAFDFSLNRDFISFLRTRPQKAAVKCVCFVCGISVTPPVPLFGDLASICERCSLEHYACLIDLKLLVLFDETKFGLNLQDI